MALTFGILAGALVLAVWRPVLWQSDEAPAPKVAAPQETKPVEPAEAKPDPEALRRHAWDRISRHLAPADAAGSAAVDKSLESINQFFADRKPGVRSFAKSILSMRGKGEFVRGKLPRAEAEHHLKFLDREFSEHVFEPKELRQAIELAINDYLKTLSAIENKLLVQCQTDIRSLDPAAHELLPFAVDEAAFAGEYQKLLDQVVAEVSRDVRLGTAREVVSLVSGEIAAVVAVRVGAAVATKLGVDAGILGAGAASSWATFGLGIAAAVVVDVALDWVMKVAGHDPVTAIAEKLEGTLDHIQTLLVDGDPEAHEDYRKLKQLAAEDPDEEVRKKCQRAVRVIERSGSLGLRFELARLHEQRASLREQTLRQLVLGNATP